MYKLIKNPLFQQPVSVLRTDGNAFIPFDHANTDCQAYLKWLEEGNTPKPADEAAPAPSPQPSPQPSPPDSVTFETIQLDRRREYLILKVACKQTGVSVLINVDDAYGNNQQSEGVIDSTGMFAWPAPLIEMQDGPLEITAIVYGSQGDLQAQATFELSRGV